MNDEEKKTRGRPRKYDTDAERKKAYRVRKKEEQSKLETRAKRITELKNRIDTIERKVVKSTYSDQHVPEEISDIHEQIKDRSRRYAPSELMELELHELKRIRDHILNRYHGSFYNPLLSALESAVMPSVDREFDSRKPTLKQKPHEVIVEEKLVKEEDEFTPKTDIKPDEYLQKAKQAGASITEEDLFVKQSTMEKKNIKDQRHWKYLKNPFRTDQLFDVFQELILFYTVEAEIARRERESIQVRDIERLEKRIKDLEKSVSDEKEGVVRESYNKRMKK